VPRAKPKPRTVWEDEGAKRPEPSIRRPADVKEPSRAVVREPSNGKSGFSEQSRAVVREPSSGRLGFSGQSRAVAREPSSGKLGLSEQSRAVVREPSSVKLGQRTSHDVGSQGRAERRSASGAPNPPEGDPKAALKSDRAKARDVRAANEAKAKAALVKREQLAENSVAKLRDGLFCTDPEQGPKSASEIAYENACLAHVEKVTKGAPKRGANSYVDMRERRGLAFGSRKT